jgi:hypothetical protein
MSSRVRSGLWSRRGYARALDVTKPTVDTGLDLTQDVIPLLYRLLCQCDDPTIDTNLTASNVSILYGDPIQCAVDGVNYVYVHCKGVEKLLYSQCIDAFSQLTPFLCDIRVVSSPDTHTAIIVLKISVTEASHVSHQTSNLSNKTSNQSHTQTIEATSREWPMLVRVGLGIIHPSIKQLQVNEGSTVFSRLHTTDQLIVVNLMNLLEILLGTLAPYNTRTLSDEKLPSCALSFNIENTVTGGDERDTFGKLKLSCKAMFDISMKDISCLIHVSTTHIKEVWFDLVQSTLVVEWQAYGVPIANCWLSAEFIGGGGAVKTNDSGRNPLLQKSGMACIGELNPLHSWTPTSYPVHM